MNESNEPNELWQRPAMPPRVEPPSGANVGPVAVLDRPAEPSQVESHSQTETVRKSGSGLRVALAFAAGAAISAGSFGLGTLGRDTEPASSPVTVASVAAPSTLAPSQPDPTLPVAPVPTATDPAAFVASVLGPSVVQVETNAGLGSGVVFDEGLILTNNHVIDGATRISVRTSDGRTFDATVLGTDPRNDIAVLDIGAEAGLPVAALATDSPQVGQIAVAIGSPFQLQQTVTSGIVSALNRPVRNNSGGFTAMIQTDAPINPGNSGGALANRSGEVIGINTSIRTDGSSNSNVGIGFAVPIETALNVADRVRNGESMEVGVLGIQSATTPDNEVGVVIGEIVEGGAAAVAGLRSGDRLLTINGAPVTNFAEVVGLVQSKFGGDSIDLEVVRAGQTITIQATLG